VEDQLVINLGGEEADRLKPEVPDGGVLYALTNTWFPGLLKIGNTSGRACDRARDLQGTGVPAPFTVAWESRPLANVAKAEAAVHLRLSGHREYKNREFFRLSLSDALPALEAAEAKHLDQAWLEKEHQRKQEEERREKQEEQRRKDEERRRRGRLAEQASVVMAWSKWKASPAYRAAVREIQPSRQRWWDSSILKQFVRPLVYAGSLLLLLWRPSLVVDLLGLIIAGVVVLYPALLIIIWLVSSLEPLSAAWSERARIRRRAARCKRANVWLPAKRGAPEAAWRQLAQSDWHIDDLERRFRDLALADQLGRLHKLQYKDHLMCWVPACDRRRTHKLAGQPLCSEHAGRCRGDRADRRAHGALDLDMGGAPLPSAVPT
jgi:hypothetical protein